jgi:hypothetical protein
MEQPHAIGSCRADGALIRRYSCPVPGGQRAKSSWFLFDRKWINNTVNHQQYVVTVCKRLGPAMLRLGLLFKYEALRFMSPTQRRY